MAMKKQVKMVSGAAVGPLSWVFVTTFKLFKPFFDDPNAARAKTMSRRWLVMRKTLQVLALIVIAIGLCWLALTIAL